MTDGKPSSLVDWFRDWRLPLHRFLRQRGVGSAADIEDIAQEVFLRLLQYNRSELIDYPQAYLYKIAANVSAEWAMRSNRSKPHSAEWLAELIDTFGPEEECEQQAAEAEILRIINTLPPRVREVVRLHFGQGLTLPDIATRLQLTARMVKRDLERAYTMLRAALDPSLADVVWSRLSAGTLL